MRILRFETPEPRKRITAPSRPKQAASTAAKTSCYDSSDPEKNLPTRRSKIPEKIRPDIAKKAEEYNLLRARLAAAVRGVCPRWMLNRQEDIVQVGMIALLHQQKKQKRRDFPASYLRRVAYTATVDEIRRLRRLQEVPIEEPSGEDPSYPSSSHQDPERQALSQEISANVRDCVQQLPTPRRLTVTLHLLSYRVPQIAKKLSMGKKRTENLVYRGIKDLRRCLKNKGIAP